MKEKSVKVAVVQAAPILFNLEETIKKAISLIKEAAENGAKLVVFPEAFIPCYPRGLSFGFILGSRTDKGREDYQRYYDNSIAVPGPHVDQLAKAAADYNIYLSMGVTQKDGHQIDGTLHCANLFFGPTEGFLGSRKKIKPTGSERTVWGEDDGSSLRVYDTPYGKMGALICWENYMPLARAALYQQGINLYIVPTADQRDIYQSTLRHIAFEGRCFVLNSNQYVEKSMYPKDLNYYADLESFPEIMCRGGSAIINPYGEYLAGPLYDREGIIYADLDLNQLIQSKMDFDPIGHYSRPDIFEFKVNNGLNNK